MARMHTRHGTIAVALVAAALGWFAGHGTGIGPVLDPASPAVGKEPRFPQLTMDQLNDAQRPLGEAIMKISAVGIAGPYNPMLRSPVFGQRMFDLLDYLRWHSSLPPRLSEFAILVTGRLPCSPMKPRSMISSWSSRPGTKSRTKLSPARKSCSANNKWSTSPGWPAPM